MRIFALVLFFSFTLSAQQVTHYFVEFPNAAHHEAEITATFEGAMQPDLELVMSRSSPGRYALADFVKNIYNVRISDEAGKPLHVERRDPYSWHVSGYKSTVVMHYTLFGDHADGTYNGIDSTHAHLNLPATFVWARGYAQSPSTFRFKVQPGSNWKIATQLLPQGDGTFRAPNLEWMMDSPVELSDYTSIAWKIKGADFRLALHHRGTEAEAEEYARRCQAIVLEEEGVMGALPRYDGGTYTFIADFLPYVFGDGMEHRDSTVMSSTADLHSSMQSLSGIASHEFFHAWNVRRMRPRSLEPFDFERANMSGELWFAEGFTNYYGLLALTRAGLSTSDDFYRSMANGVDAVLNSPGRKIYSPVEMSRLAPFVDAAKSVDANNFGNTYISYYTYGQALAFGIDLTIRQRFPGKSLDDWMRTVWRNHPDIERPYTLGDLEEALAEVSNDRSFARRVFQSHIEGKEALDYGALASAAGLVLRKAHPGHVWLGLLSARGSSASAKPSSAGLTIEGEPRAGSPFYNAGLVNGDIILAVDGLGADGKAGADLKEQLEKHKPGDRVQVRARTRSGDRAIEVEMSEDPRLELATFESTGRPVTPEVAAFRKSWLSSKALHPLPKNEPLRSTN